MSKRNWIQIVVGLLFGGLMIGVAVVQFQEANAKSLESTAVLAADTSPPTQLPQNQIPTVKDWGL